MARKSPSSPFGIAFSACLGVIVAASIAAAVQGCHSLSAESETGCQQLGIDPGTLSQTWAIAGPPEALGTGTYIVTLSSGEAEIAGVSLGGSELLITIPVPAEQIPAGGIGINTVQINGQWVQLGCPAITN